MLQAHPPIDVTDLTFDLNKAKKSLPENHYYVYKIIYDLNKNPPDIIELPKTSFLEIVTENGYSFIFFNKQGEPFSVAIGDILSFKTIDILEQKNNLKFTEFLRLIKDMEIGKPSTYGYILEKLFSGENAYLEVREGNVYHTKIGANVYANLRENSSPLSSFKITIEIETMLDDIERGDVEPVDALNEYLSPYKDFEIYSLDVDFELNEIKEDFITEEDLSYLIPGDHYLQGVKLSVDTILSTREDGNSDKYYKLKVLHDYYNINSIESLSERLKYDLIFKWFMDLGIAESIPSFDALTNFIFSDLSISLKDVVEKKF